MTQEDQEDPRQDIVIEDTHQEVDLIQEIDTKEDIDQDQVQIHVTEEEVEETQDVMTEEKVVPEVYLKANLNHLLMIQPDNNKMIKANHLQMKIINKKMVLADQEAIVKIAVRIRIMAKKTVLLDFKKIFEGHLLLIQIIRY